MASGAPGFGRLYEPKFSRVAENYNKLSQKKIKNQKAEN
jgi:hypothetical protein